MCVNVALERSGNGVANENSPSERVARVKSAWLASGRTPSTGAIPTPETLGDGRSTNASMGVHLRKSLAGVVNPVLYQSIAHPSVRNTQLLTVGRPTHQVNASLIFGSATFRCSDAQILRSVFVCNPGDNHRFGRALKPP